MSKKKVVLIVASLCMVLMLAIGGTIAYFTDTDEATNTFTVGNVKIDLIEQQRSADGKTLEDFKNNKVLMPIVGSAQGDKDQFGLPLAKNYVDKIITVKNLASDAYVRVFVAIPTVLDNVGDASQNVLHFNPGNKFVAAGGKTDGQAVNPDWANWSNEKLEAQGVTVKGVVSNIYSYTYNKVMTKDQITGSACVVGFYLDKGFDMNADGKYTINGTVIDFDFSKGVTIPVFAQGVQADGFADAASAFAASGLPANPWANP